ncbi:MAG: preprotein translocase subunit SecG [bacterium]|nr:preprotein translocase subunit SecG [bacterium]
MDLSNILGLISQLKPYLPAAQIVVALLLIILILLQPRGEALGSAFGQSFATVGKLRGASKSIFWFTIVLGVIFILLALLNLVV